MHRHADQIRVPDLRLPEVLAGSRPKYHFSIDDVFECLIEASDHFHDLFAHPVFGFLKRMNDRYGAQVDLYLFNQAVVDGRLRTLNDVSPRFRHQLQMADWLRFGPHAHNYATPPHSQTPAQQRDTFDETYWEIERFAGPGKTTRWNRLHFFSECYELANYFRLRGSDVMLLTDKPASAYRLSSGAIHRLRRRGWLIREGLNLLQSHYRFECFERDRVSGEDIHSQVRGTLRERGYLSLFTHEVDMKRDSVLQIAEHSLRCAASIADPANVAPLPAQWTPRTEAVAPEKDLLWNPVRYSVAAGAAGD